MYVQESVLSFSKVQQSDSSNYVCLAMNSLGEDRKKFKLTVVSEIVVFVRPQKQVCVRCVLHIPRYSVIPRSRLVTLKFYFDFYLKLA